MGLIKSLRRLMKAAPVPAANDSAEPCSALLSNTQGAARFGCPELAARYAQAQALIDQFQILRICRLIDLPAGPPHLELCGLWRVGRTSGGPLTITSRDFSTGSFSANASSLRAPPLQLIEKGRAAEAGKTLLYEALHQVLRHVGLHDRADWWKHRPLPPRRSLTPEQVGTILIRGLLGSPERKRKGRMDPESLANGIKSFRRAFWQHLADRELVSAGLAIKFDGLPLSRYTTLEAQRDAVLRVAREKRNCLPLLNHIEPDQWRHCDLFSRQRWARAGRSYTQIDRAPFLLEACKGRRLSLESLAGWRWLSRAPHSVVAEYRPSRRGVMQQFIEQVAAAKFSGRVPACVYAGLLRHAVHLYRPRDSDYAALFQRSLRLYLQHHAHLWLEEGYAAVRVAAKNGPLHRLGPILDFLRAEGYGAGFPDRNMSFATLERHSQLWHRAEAMKSIEAQSIESWECAWSETTIDGVLFKPLTSSQALALEGAELDHCVATYAPECAVGEYFVFAVYGPGHERATLGITLTPSIVLDQLQGPRNSPVSQALEKASRALIRSLRKDIHR